MKRIYLDNAATTAPYPAVLAAMTDTAQRFYGNPSSLHSEGQAAQKLLSDCRARMAARLGCAPDELYFTSGGSEADNWAIRGLAQAGAKKGKRRIVTSAFEHHAVLHTLKALEKEGFAVTYLPVHEDGYVRPAELAAALRDDTALATVMYANNEIGTIQPVAELAQSAARTASPSTPTRCRRPDMSASTSHAKASICSRFRRINSTDRGA